MPLRRTCPIHCLSFGFIFDLPWHRSTIWRGFDDLRETSLPASQSNKDSTLTENDLRDARHMAGRGRDALVSVGMDWEYAI